MPTSFLISLSIAVAWLDYVPFRQAFEAGGGIGYGNCSEIGDGDTHYHHLTPSILLLRKEYICMHVMTKSQNQNFPAVELRACSSIYLVYPRKTS